MEPVRSPRNPRVGEAVRLRRARERRTRHQTLLEGPHLLAEAAAAGAAIVEVFGLAGDEDARRLAEQSGAVWIPVEQPVLDRLAPTETPRGPVAVLAYPAPVAPSRDFLWLELGDPGNAGTLVRTAAAFGLDVAAPAGTVDLWSPKVLRAAAGGHFHTGVAQPWELGDDVGRIVTVLEGGIAPAALADLDRTRRWAVLIGSEAHGLGAETRRTADVSVTIPMPGGTESLNAAVAGAIVAYELARQRQ